MSAASDSVSIPIRRRPIVVFALVAGVVLLLMLWGVFAYLPSDPGGLAGLMRPLLPLAALAVAVEVGRYVRGAAVGVIEANVEGLVLPWFWWGSHRLTRWSEVVSVEVGTVVWFRLRTRRVRLMGPGGEVQASVAERWVQEWESLLDAVGKQCGEIRATPPIGAWDAAAADGLVRPRPRWMPRRRS